MVVVAAVLEEEEGAAVPWWRLRRRLSPRWKATLVTNPGSSSSGCTSPCVVTFASQLPSRGRWISSNQALCGCT